MNQDRLVIATFDTLLGYMAVAADSDGVLFRIWFDYPSESDLRLAIKATIDTLYERDVRLEFDDRAHGSLVRRFKKFAREQVDTFADVKIDESWMTAFQQRVIGQTRRIRFGKTLSYGQLAQKSGCPGAARAVGSVMAKNRFPLIVPCHRVVASGNRLGGFSCVNGLKTKTRLLRMEGSANEKGALMK